VRTSVLLPTWRRVNLKKRFNFGTAVLVAPGRRKDCPDLTATALDPGEQYFNRWKPAVEKAQQLTTH
jgi:hypothetical protein